MADNVMARQQTKWTVISIAPDVCKTPMGSSVRKCSMNPTFKALT